MGSLGTSPPRLSTIGELEISPETTFGTPAAYVYVQQNTQPDVSGIHRQHFPNEAIRGTVDKQYAHIMAPAGVVPLDSSFQTSHYMSGFLGTLPTAADILAAQNATTGYPLVWILKALLGGQAYGGTGTEGAAASSVSSISFIAGGGAGSLDASLIDAGHAFAIQTATGYEAGFAKSADMATDIVVPRLNFEAAPSADSTIYGGVTSYATPSLDGSFSLRWTGWLENTSTPLRFVASGCVPAQGEIKMDARGLPLLNVTWRFATMTWTSGITPGSGYNGWSYGAGGSVDVPAPEAIVGRRFVSYTAVDTYADLETPTFALAVDNDLQPFPDPNGPGGIKTFRRGPGYSIKATIRIPYTAETWWESQTELGVQCTHGSQPGRMIAVSLPRVHAVDPPAGPSDESGYAYATYVLEALRYVNDIEPAGGQAADNRICSVALC